MSEMSKIILDGDDDDSAVLVKLMNNLMKECEIVDLYDEDLWYEFNDCLKSYDEKDFLKINRQLLQRIRTFLRQRGVWLDMDISKCFFILIKETASTL
jgi:hypothetical protein